MLIENVVDPGREWDEFAESMSGCSLGHASGWARVLNRAYRLRPVYLAARSNSGEIRGILPLVVFPTYSGARQLVSLPYLDAAGMLAADVEVEAALLARAQELVRENRARSLEIRNLRPAEGEAAPMRQDRVNLVLDLEQDIDQQWKSLRGKVRNQTRKAEREGLVVAQGSPELLLEGFYAPFCVNMRDLGSPVHSRRFFSEMASTFGDRLRFCVAELDERPVGGLVAIRYGQTVTIPWASTLRSERSKCPNNLIYWEALQWAVKGGAKRLDFGRSPPGSGTYQFKRGWGAVESPLAWLRFEPSGQPISAGLATQSPLLQRASAIWTRLPCAIANRLGPRLRRYLSN